MSWGISFPLDQILLLFVICPIAEDLFNFPFQFAFYEVQWGSQEVQAVGRCFVVRGQEGHMEYIVDFSVVREF
jgi:hypothetical protein